MSCATRGSAQVAQVPVLSSALRSTSQFVGQMEKPTAMDAIFRWLLVLPLPPSHKPMRMNVQNVLLNSLSLESAIGGTELPCHWYSSCHEARRTSKQIPTIQRLPEENLSSHRSLRKRYGH